MKHKKYILQLTPTLRFPISFGWWTRLWKKDLSGLLSLTVKGSRLWLLVLATSVPIWLSSTLDFESNLVYGLFVFVIIGVWIILVQILLVGTKVIIDPPGIIGALLGAFFILLAYLLSSPDSANTFGVDGSKYLGGVVMMSMIGVYYLIVNFAWLKGSFWSTHKWVELMMLVSIIVLLLSGALPVAYISLPVVFIPAFLFGMVWSENIFRSSIYAFALLFASIIAFMDTELAVVNVVVGIVSIWLGASWFVSHRSNPSKEIKLFRGTVGDYFKGNIGFKNFARPLSGLLLSLFGVIWLILTLVWSSTLEIGWVEVISEPLGSFIDTLRQIGSWEQLFIGGGAQASQITQTTLVNTTRMQGIIGLLGYAVLYSSGLWMAVRLLFFGDIDKNKKHRVSFIWGGLMLAVPLLSLFLNVGIFMILVWWFVYAMLALGLMKENSSEDMVAENGLLSKISKSWEWLIKLVLVALSALGLGWLLQQLWDLFLTNRI